MARLLRLAWMAALVLTGCETALQEGKALEIEIFGENVLEGKSVYSIAVAPIDPRLTSRYWADVGSSEGQGGNYRTLEVGWLRRPEIHYYQIVLFWTTNDPEKLSGIVFDFQDKSLVDLQVVDNGKRSILSLNLKNVTQENIGRLRRVVLRFDHTRARTELDSVVKAYNAGDPQLEADSLNQRAWYLATFPVEAVRNGKQALADAARAVQLSNDANHRDTLAAAYAEIGDFENAMREQQRAIDSLDTKIQETREQCDLRDPEVKVYLSKLSEARNVFKSHYALFENSHPVRKWDYPY